MSKKLVKLIQDLIKSPNLDQCQGQPEPFLVPLDLEPGSNQGDLRVTLVFRGSSVIVLMCTYLSWFVALNPGPYL